MDQIITFLSSILGFVMDLFFRGLTLIGYPRLWACIVLYAAVTRLLFLTDRISSYRTRLFTPVVNLDLLEVDANFFDKTKDKELAAKRSILKREVENKYKIGNRSGCLVSIIQYPFLVALFRVVKNPQDFIPSLEVLASTSPLVTSFFGASLSVAPKDFGDAAGAEWIAFVPFLVMLSNFFKMFRSLKTARTVSQKLKVYSLCGTITLLMGWFSSALPLALSFYWITNDVVNRIIDYFIKKATFKNPENVALLKDYNERLNAMKAKRAEEAQQGCAVTSE